VRGLYPTDAQVAERAISYGDQTVWILDAPGHAPGHICMLVQTAPDAWHLLGGDGAHHVSLIDAKSPTTMGTFKAKDNPSSDQSDPEKLTCFEDDPAESLRTMAKLARMDQEETVNVWLAHDASLGEPLISSDCEKLSAQLILLF
jgi:glyoxylase-like metal-dependent hydrolase (beta-lactamase superfamily II)